MKHNKADIILSLTAFIPVILLTLQVLVNGLHILTYEQTRKINIIISAVFAIIAMIIIIKRKPILLISTYFIVFLLLLLTMHIYPENTPYINDKSFNLLFVNIPVFLSISAVNEINTLKRVMLKISYMTFIIGLIYTLFSLAVSTALLSYNMSFSYFLLLPALVFASKQDILHSILFLITLFIIILFGARWPLLISLFYFIFINIFNSKNKRNTILNFIVVVVILLIANSIFKIYDLQLESSSRTLRIMQDGFFDDSGRRNIYQIIWNSIMEGPFFGYGLFSDRVILPRGAYSHNVFLELFHNFGFLVGGIIIAILIWKMIKILYNGNGQERIFFMIFIFYGFLPLFISSSYLIDSKFWILLGVMQILDVKKVSISNKYSYEQIY